MHDLRSAPLLRLPRGAWEREHPLFFLVPTLRVGMPASTLCVEFLIFWQFRSQRIPINPPIILHHHIQHLRQTPKKIVR